MWSGRIVIVKSMVFRSDRVESLFLEKLIFKFSGVKQGSNPRLSVNNDQLGHQGANILHVRHKWLAEKKNFEKII